MCTMVNVTCCSLASWLGSSGADMHVDLVRGAHIVKIDPPDKHQRLRVATFLKRHVYGRTRRPTFTQLIHRQWVQYPLPYNRMSRVVPTPGWFAECVAGLQRHVDDAVAAVAAALAGELDDESDEEDDGEEADEVEESDGEDDERGRRSRSWRIEGIKESRIRSHIETCQTAPERITNATFIHPHGCIVQFDFGVVLSRFIP
jgi:hypothetical protein